MGEASAGAHSDAATIRGSLEAALADQNGLLALALIEGLSEAERPDWLARSWLLIGSPRALRPLLVDIANPQLRAEVEAVVRGGLPPAPLPTGDYDALRDRAEWLAARGLAHPLALAHLALAELAPRVDWRAQHVEHAASLAESLGDPRLTALVVAFEARLDAGFGEQDDALERAREAIRLAEESDEPRALSLALMVLANASSDPALAARAIELAARTGFELHVGAWGLTPPARPEPDGA